MKKLIYLLFIAQLFTFCSNGQKQKNDLSAQHLKGKIKSIKSERFEATEKSDEIQKGKVTTTLITLFNEQGNTIEFDVDTLYKTTYKYDDKGNKIEVDIKSSIQSMSGKQLNQYNNKGQLIEENNYNSDDSLQNKTIYKYDDDGNQIELICTLPNGKLSNKQTSKYDNKGNMIEHYTYSPDGRFNFKSIYKYDNKGNAIEKNEYDEKGRLLRKEISKFDDEGNEIESTDTFSDGSPTEKYTFKTEFDNKLNWIKRIDFKDGVPFDMVINTIEYYP